MNATADRAVFDALVAEISPTRATGAAADEFRALARELSALPRMWRWILVEHTASADGRYCRARQCRLGGCGSLAAQFPCSVRVLAEMAQGIHAAGEAQARETQARATQAQAARNRGDR